MGLRIYNLTQQTIVLSDPLDGVLLGRTSRTFPNTEYDKTINDKRYANLLRKEQVRIINLDEDLIRYDSNWFGPSKFRLGTYHLWVDMTNHLRMKTGGDASHDTDGVIIGPGGTPSPHGSTHVFNGLDPVPNIEVLEELWDCPSSVNVNNAVYQTGPNSVDRALAATNATMPAIGVVISKPTATTCIIARSGLIPYAGLPTADARYYVSAVSAGAITTSPPTGANRVVQKVGYSRTTALFVVELGETRRRA